MRYLTMWAMCAATLALAGCAAPKEAQLDYDLGERANIGPLSYQVVESKWVNQLGDSFNVRMPQQRFLIVTLSITNGGGKDVALPLLSLENSGKLFQESEDGSGVDNWMGLLRTIAPAETKQGKLVFDVPLSSFRLRLPDVSETGYDRYAWVKIPLTIDSEDLQPSRPNLY